MNSIYTNPRLYLLILFSFCFSLENTGKYITSGIEWISILSGVNLTKSSIPDQNAFTKSLFVFFFCFFFLFQFKQIFSEPIWEVICFRRGWLASAEEGHHPLNVSRTLRSFPEGPFFFSIASFLPWVALARLIHHGEPRPRPLLITWLE